MSELYPFPIPESIKNKVLRQTTEASPPWASLDHWGECDDDPEIFGYFNHWQWQVAGVLEAVELIKREVEPQMAYKDDSNRAHWIALNGSLCALKLMVSQFAGLLEWARLTWQHDPQICAAFEHKTTLRKTQNLSKSDKVIHLHHPSEPVETENKGE